MQNSGKTTTAVNPCSSEIVCKRRLAYSIMLSKNVSEVPDPVVPPIKEREGKAEVKATELHKWFV